MTASAASLYQIDERGLELRRSYLRVTSEELRLLASLRPWAEQVADGLGAALAEHTFGFSASGQFLAEYAREKGVALADLKHHWGAAQAGHFQAIFSEAAKPNGFGVAYFEGLLAVGALHSKINLPLKWFLGTYPVFVDLVARALRDTPPAIALKPASRLPWAKGADRLDYELLSRIERAIARIFNFDQQAITEAFLHDTFACMGVDLARVDEAGPGRDISDLFASVRSTVHQTLQRFGASSFEVQDMCATMNERLSETGRAIHEIAESASKVAEGAVRQADVAAQGRSAVEQAFDAATGAGEISRTGIEAAGGAAEALEDARSRIEGAATAITALAARSGQVGGIVEAIQDIARQTNLLALNAAIEAARAGERGKGFAVVADEVRQLAERAARSAADAGELIAGIQGETNEAVELVRDAARRADAGTEASTRARTSLEEIDGAVGRITLELQGMGELTQSIAAVAEETAASAEQMSAATEQTNASTQEIVGSVAQLTEHSEQLAQLTEGLDLTR